MKKEAQFGPKEKKIDMNIEFESKYPNKMYKKYTKDKPHKFDNVNMREPYKDNQKHFKHDFKEKEDDKMRDKLKKCDNKYVYKGRLQKANDVKCDKNKAFDKNVVKENRIKTKTNDEYKKKSGECSGEKFSKFGKNKCTNPSETDGFYRNAKNKYREKNMQNFVLLDRKNETVDGTWLGRLFKGRDELRHKDKMGEWFFDRSSHRKRKRDKSGWYFDWMMDRELQRYRRLYLNI